MKQTIRRKFLLGLMIITALFSLVPTSVFAAGNTIYLNLPSGTSQPGSNFPVSVDGHVMKSGLFGSPGVTGKILYPENLLKVVSISTVGSNFNVSSSINYTSTKGVISFTQSTNWWTPPNDQDVHLFSITFQSLTNGTATVMPSGVSYTNTGAAVANGGTYTISSPAPPTPVPTPNPTPAPSVTPTKPSATPTPTKTPAPSAKSNITPVPSSSVIASTEQPQEPVIESEGGLKIENVKITTDRVENTIVWTMNNPIATATVTYGTVKNNLTSTAEITKQADGNDQVILSDLQPGTQYYFSIKATTDDNLQGATYSGVLTTRGYPVELTIKQNNLLLPGAKVSIGNRNFIANKDGLVTTELGDGTFKAVVTPIGSTVSFESTFVVVEKTTLEDNEPVTQKFVINNTTPVVSTGSNSSLILPIAGGTIGTIALLGGITGFVIYRRRQQLQNPAIATNDLLLENYGSAIREARGNAPSPNIDPQSNQYSQQSDQTSPIATNNGLLNQTSGMTNTPTSLTAGLPEAFDTTTLPLPSSLSTTELDQHPVPETQPGSSRYSEIEQLSPEISQIEATQQIASDEPSAVYDESTGELDIIHHHTNEPAVSEPTALLSSQPVESNDVALPQTDSQLPRDPQIPLKAAHS